MTFLRHQGKLGAEDVIDRILAQPSTAPFVATNVVQHFVTGRPSTSYIAALGDAFRRSRYDMKTLMRAIFKSPEFTADQSYRALVKSPVEFMVHAARALGNPSIVKVISGAGSGMGQTLFDP